MTYRAEVLALHPAYALADELLTTLSPACVRIEIAGSLRRLKPEPHDIEIVCRPATGTFENTDMFGYVTELHYVNHLDNTLDLLLSSGVWEFDTVNPKNGPNYKRIKHAASGICCDLFIVTDPRKWGIIKTIRTGSRQFSEDLVTLARRKGCFVQRGLLHGHEAVLDDRREVKECPAGEACIRIKPTPEETDFFAALGVPWVEPKYRTTLNEALHGAINDRLEVSA